MASNILGSDTVNHKQHNTHTCSAYVQINTGVHESSIGGIEAPHLSSPLIKSCNVSSWGYMTR